MKTTICIPTKNRSQFLGRLLRYYAETRCRQQIFIGDSSDPYDIERNKRTIQSLRSQLNMDYFECPGMGVSECQEYLSDSVSTPYSTCVADDDILCPRGIEQCAEFLDSNPDYVAAHGIGIFLATDRKGPYGRILDVKRYPLGVLEADTGSQRLIDHLTVSTYGLFFSVFRTADWLDIFRGLSTLKGTGHGNIFKNELISTAICAVRGKVKELDCLMAVRDLSAGSYRGSFVYDWLTAPEWHPSYELFRQRLTEELVRQDGISQEEAQEVIKRALWPFLARALSAYWQKYNQPSTGSNGSASMSPRKLARRIPGLRRLWHSSRQLGRAFGRNDISLLALLRPSSPYHEDFMPIYRAITTPPAEVFDESVTGKVS